MKARYFGLSGKSFGFVGANPREAACGNVKMNVAPAPSSLSAHIVPPCAITICFEIARPSACAAGIARASLVYPIEPLEDAPVRVLKRNAGSKVPPRKTPPGRPLPAHQPPPAAGFAIFHRVFNQVAENLVQRIGIRNHHGIRRLTRLERHSRNQPPCRPASRSHPTPARKPSPPAAAPCSLPIPRSPAPANLRKPIHSRSIFQDDRHEFARVVLADMRFFQ